MDFEVTHLRDTVHGPLLQNTIDLGFKGGDTDIHFSPRQNSETVLSLPSRQFKMSLGVVRLLAILAIMAPAIFLSVSADNYNGKWGNSVAKSRNMEREGRQLWDSN